jgi:hypothetical protein
MSEIKYSVIDHHSMWGWPKQNTTPEEAEIVFVWNDFTIKEDVQRWQKEGKKVICFEHGWNAFFDYKLNNHIPIADGFLALGKNSAKSLIECGLNQQKVLITGNPNLGKIRKIKPYFSPHRKKILYTALHWTRDLYDYNNAKLGEIINTFSSVADIYVKTNDKSKIRIPDGVLQWNSNINENEYLFKDIMNGLKNFDLVLTPKESTFDFIALKIGKKVFRIGKPEEYRHADDPNTRSILPYEPISIEFLNKNCEIMVNLEDELSKSIKMSKILKWVIEA